MSSGEGTLDVDVETEVGDKDQTTMMSVKQDSSKLMTKISRNHAVFYFRRYNDLLRLARGSEYSHLT